MKRKNRFGILLKCISCILLCALMVITEGVGTVSATASKALFHFCNDKGKWGYMDANGKVIVKPKYDETWEFSEGRAVVVRNKKAGVIDATGKEIVKPAYQSIDLLISNKYSEGLLEMYKQDGTIVYIDKSGKEKIKLDKKYVEAYDFHEGYAGIIEKNGSTSVIDKNGKIVFHMSAKYQFSADGYQEGMLGVQDEKYGCGFMDKKGNLVVKPVYDMTQNYSEGLAVVYQNGKYGYINKKGKVVVKPQYDSAESFSGGLACVCKKGKYGYIDKTGKIVVKLQYKDADSFSQGLAAVQSGGKYGFINKKGEFVIEPQYQSAGSFSEGMALIELKDKCGYIDKNGKVIIKPKYSYGFEFQDGVAHVGVSDENTMGWGYVNKKGKEIFMHSDSF